MSLRERILSMVDDRPIRGVPPEGLASITDEQLKPLMRRSHAEFLPNRFYTLSNDAIFLLKLLPSASALHTEMDSNVGRAGYELTPEVTKLAHCLAPHLKNACLSDGSHYETWSHLNLTLNYLYDLKRAVEQNLFFTVDTIQKPDSFNEICVDMVANFGETTKTIAGGLFINANILEIIK